MSPESRKTVAPAPGLTRRWRRLPRSTLIRLRLVLYYVPVFAVLGAWIPYWPLWLEERGATKAEIGVLIAAAIWARAVATPWFASIADRRGQRKRMLIGLTWLAAACFVPFAWADGFWPLLGLSIAFGVAYPPLIPLSDGLTVLQTRHTPGLRYGRIRLWGSVAFLVAALGLGELLESSPTAIVHRTIVVALVVAGVAGFALPDPHVEADGSGRPRPIRTLLADRGFVLILATTGLIQASHAAYYSFSTVHWKAAGIDEGTIGLLWAEGVVAEIVLFAVGAAWAERLGTVRLFVLGASAAAIRWVALASTTDVAVLASVNWLHAFSFGATHLAAIGYVARHVPRAYAATAQSLLSAIATGVATAIATMFAGAVYAADPTLAFGSMTALAVLGALCTTRIARLNRRRPVP